MKQLLKSILARAGGLKLERGDPALLQEDLALAREFLDGHEFGLCLETVMELICEAGVRVDEGFYQEIAAAAAKIGLPAGKVERIKELL